MSSNERRAPFRNYGFQTDEFELQIDDSVDLSQPSSFNPDLSRDDLSLLAGTIERLGEYFRVKILTKPG